MNIAVKFLGNPKVINVSWEKKVGFLKKKGKDIFSRNLYIGRFFRGGDRKGLKIDGVVKKGRRRKVEIRLSLN